MDDIYMKYENITNVKNLKLYLDYVEESASDYLTPLHYPATQSLLPSSFKPQLITSP